MSEKKNNTLNNIGWILVALAVLIVVIVVVIFFGQEKRTDMSLSKEQEVQGVLVCSAGTMEDAFFNIDGASQVKHEVKITMKGGRTDKLFYMYEGKLRDGEIAEANATSMNFKYDDYLGEKGLTTSRKIESTFNYVGNKVRIDLYTNVEGINPDTAVFFFLDKEKLDDLMKMDGEKLKSYYVGEGFKCNYEE